MKQIADWGLKHRRFFSNQHSAIAGVMLTYNGYKFSYEGIIDKFELALG